MLSIFHLRMIFFLSTTFQDLFEIFKTTFEETIIYIPLIPLYLSFNPVDFNFYSYISRFNALVSEFLDKALR
jgi:hypothetical protein